MSIAVPSIWLTKPEPTWPSCGESDVGTGLGPPWADVAELYTGTHLGPPYSCVPLEWLPLTLIPDNGLVVDPGPYGPLDLKQKTSQCFDINGVTACSVKSDVSDVLVLAVNVPGKTQPVAVDIGLAGSGETARTILYSIEKP